MQKGNEMTTIEEGTTNVYADLGMADAEEMIVKAQLASKIGIPQSKLSKMLSGQFRGISEAKMLDCLARLGRNVQIVVGPPRRSTTAGRIDVVFAV